MFNSKKIKELSTRVSMLEMQLMVLQNRDELRAAKSRAKEVEKPKRKYVKSGKYSKKVTTKKK